METIKLTFTGDIMCDAIEISAHKNENGQYDFADKFQECKTFFGRSDYVIGNMETPIVNEDYATKRYEFGSPVEFAIAVKECGVSLVSTANNHCLDRNVKGLEETIENLNKIGLKHTGTNTCPDGIPTGIIETIGNIKIGFLAYTYGTNAFLNSNYLNKNEKWRVNLFQEQELHNKVYRSLYNSCVFSLFRRASNKISRHILHREVFCPVYERTEKSICFDRKIQKDILSLRKSGAEYIIMCLHEGGQYNSKPRKRTGKTINKMIRYGVDAVICNHEHVIHHYEKTDSNKVKVFSLGNFTGLAGVQSEPYNKMADYSVLFNLYLVTYNGKVNIEKCTFTIAKSISISDGRIQTVLLYNLINNCTDAAEKQRLIEDNLKIYNMFSNSNRDEIELKLEYLL